MTPTLRNRSLWAGALAVALAAGALWWQFGSRSRDANAGYETAPLDRGRITARVTATGIVSALVTVQVGSQVSGRIKEILVDFNSPVKRGQILARLDPLLLEAARAQARANQLAAQGDLESAKAKAADAERIFSRARDMRAQKLIAQADVDTAQANAESARAQVESANGRVAQALAALQQAEVSLAYATIASPIDGTVVSRNVDVGQTVAASLQAPTLFVIAQDLRAMQVDTSVAEADIGQLRSGMTATFSVDAYPGQRFSGTVRQIRDAPQIVQNVVTYDAVIDVANPELRLKPGMTANVSFVYADVDNALRIPNAALRFRPATNLPGPAPGAASRGDQAQRKPREPSNARTVWVLRDGKPLAVPIHTGISDGSYTEVKDGELHEGDPIITDTVGSTASAEGAKPGQNPFRRGL